MPITISGTGSITGIVTGGLPNNIVTYSGLASTTFASVTEMAGITTTGVTTASTTAVTLTGSGLAASIFNGDYVTGAGVAPGTTVSSGGGTSNLVLSANVGFTTSSNALSFYSGNKVVTEGVIGGQLCRAWVNFDGTHATPKIRGAFNVSSITKNGTGDYTVTFATAMPDANYAASISQNPDWGVRHTFSAAINTNGTSFLEAAPASNAFRFYIAAANTAAFDPKYVNVAVFR